MVPDLQRGVERAAVRESTALVFDFVSIVLVCISETCARPMPCLFAAYANQNATKRHIRKGHGSL